MASISPARKAAFQILLAIERGAEHSDDLLRGKNLATLSAADRNLTTALVLGVLRWQIRLDAQVQSLLTRPGAKLDVEARIVLRLGAFQLLHMDRIPPHAAIGESVELVKHAGHQFASGMVNAVLRRLGASSRNADFSEQSSTELASVCAHPAWMVERWEKFYGIEAARAICSHGQTQPAQTIRVESSGVETELAESGVGLRRGQLISAARTVTTGELIETPAFRDGRVRLQDEGSQLVAEIAGRAKIILDCCAAPGGKTMILAERNPETRIVACESSPQRLEQLRGRLARLGDRVEFRLCDTATLSDACLYDLALADVPCSGTGTLGRNPEIRHRLRLNDLPRMAERQKAILRAALRSVRPGGRVVYSTCSLEPEENEQVVAAVIAESQNVRAVPIHDRIDEMMDEAIIPAGGAKHLLSSVTSEGYLRLLPGTFHTDGFFVATMEKTDSEPAP
jgi:16S rRNA (cytosine967-C5)-methyltransferase